jgi:hypothetical protein
MALSFSECIGVPLAEPDASALTYPFSYLDDYGVQEETFVKGLLGEENCDAGKFPNNIDAYYWIYKGCNDEQPWYCLCKLDNGNYAFYKAWCDYTGFDCQGGMYLIVSRDLKRLFEEGLTDSERKLCIKDKQMASDK